MTIYNTQSQKIDDYHSDELGISSFLDNDDWEEDALWKAFEAQDELGWDGVENDAYCFSEDGISEADDIPPRSAQLINDFSSLALGQREMILSQVKLLIEHELGKR